MRCLRLSAGTLPRETGGGVSQKVAYEKEQEDRAIFEDKDRAARAAEMIRLEAISAEARRTAAARAAAQDQCGDEVRQLEALRAKRVTRDAIAAGRAMQGAAAARDAALGIAYDALATQMQSISIDPATMQFANSHDPHDTPGLAAVATLPPSTHHLHNTHSPLPQRPHLQLPVHLTQRQLRPCRHRHRYRCRNRGGR